MAALGSAPTYFDFDMFQEMQVTTGGADLTMATGGVGLNMVLKSGSNTPRGSTRFYFENEDMQSNNLPDELAAFRAWRYLGKRQPDQRIHGLRWRAWWSALEKSALGMGCLRQDRRHASDPRNRPDQTILDNRSFKATGQVTKNLRGNYTYFRGDKPKFGREPASPVRRRRRTIRRARRICIRAS